MENKLSILNINHQAKRYYYFRYRNYHWYCLSFTTTFFSYKKIHNAHRDSTSVDGFLYYFKHVQEEGKLDSQYRETKWTIENEK